jgi:hypothetical protein
MILGLFEKFNLQIMIMFTACSLSEQKSPIFQNKAVFYFKIHTNLVNKKKWNVSKITLHSKSLS